MAKIYKNFEDLVEQNKGLFSVILKNGNINVLEAIWNARQSEIDALKVENQTLKKANNSLSDTNSANKIELEVLGNQRDILCSEMTTMKNMIDSSKKINNDLKLQISSANEKFQILENETKGRVLEHESALRERDLLLARYKKLDSDYKLLSYQFSEFKENCDREMQENITIFENVMIERENFKQHSLDLENELKNLKSTHSNLQINYERAKDLIDENKKLVQSKESEIKRLTISNENKSEEIAHFVNSFTEFQKKLTSSKLRKSVSEINQ